MDWVVSEGQSENQPVKSAFRRRVFDSIFGLAGRVGGAEDNGSETGAEEIGMTR